MFSLFGANRFLLKVELLNYSVLGWFHSSEARREMVGLTTTL